MWGVIPNLCSAVSYFSTRVGSIIGADRLSFRVRDGTGRFPAAVAAVTLFFLRLHRLLTLLGVVWWWGVVCLILIVVWLRARCAMFFVLFTRTGFFGVCKFSAG